ncbi:MAG TPA: permease prefix domain 1-containing protein [Coriobacteriia bacterium]|nr:permease prefix domain 1-containing protein [Coriobacteriia bacterium]
MEAIKYYVKGAFVGIAETPEVLEQQEELIADLTAKVEDLVAEGKTEDEALGVAIASMGDLSGLVREFVVDEPTPQVVVAAPEPKTAEVYVRKLRLHVDIVAVGGALAALFVLSVLAALAGAAASGAAMWDLVFGVAAVAVVANSLVRFHEQPDAVETVTVSDGTALRKALMIWAGVCAFAFVFNLAFENNGFWAWTAWIAAAAWPARVWVERWFIERGSFAHPRQEAPVPADVPSTASACS